ncbi:hypothetical protein E2C02_34730, partial [Streptomyces sp. WAC05374]|uniref:hypothetical protein n=1 Tax=Streptomyces sp. WAC05374 TaxID=2487420 RepID=UPI0010622C1E
MGVRANDDSATPAGPAAAGSPTGVPPAGETAGETAGRPSGAPTPGSAPGAGRTAQGSEYDVVWYERHDRFGASLRVAPLSVSGLLREKLFAERSVVLTSATLKL